MMTTTPSATRPSPRSGPPTTATLTPSTHVLLFGHLAWLGFVWLAATVVYAVVVSCVARWGSLDESLWPSVAGGWQRYVIFSAGVTIATTFLRMLVRNGVTRRTLSTAATITMAVIAVFVGLWNVAGMAVERVVYDANGWSQALHSDAVLQWGDLPRVGIDSALVVAAYYACGWIVGMCFYRWGVVGGLLRLLPALVPAALMELVVSPDFGGMDVDVLASWRDRPPVLLTLVAGAALLAATVWIARRITREASIR
jgi:hypothetical protein